MPDVLTTFPPKGEFMEMHDGVFGDTVYSNSEPYDQPHEMPKPELWRSPEGKLYTEEAALNILKSRAGQK